MVNLEWYRSFKAIYQIGTLTGAAQELLISQPNVSQHLSALEAHIGKQLFERKPRRMVPTEYGKLFYTQIIEAVDKLEHVEAEFRYTRTSNIPLTCIGAPKEFFYSVLASRISQAPANLVFEFGLTKDLMQKLGKGKLYFVIATHCTDEKDIVYEPIVYENFLLVGHPDFETKTLDEYISKGDLDKAERHLCEQDWYAYSSNLTIIRRFWLENFKKRPAIKPRFIIPDFNSILKGISCGTGITVAADYLVNDLIQQKKLKEIWKGNHPTSNTLYLTYNKNNVTTEQIEMVRKILKVNATD
ncbi:LysR family transcriptional regulator [Sphingobacterium sp. SRCM116780]|uniref:LysR family transcriptional regulator n=1 Tax=Sphingobacterium sp. SRCM116780 TaxID=2907623 RepID=UPI001F27A02F|nr:LysR family transcriptional regulator [Sphingobacterium sp. SRCM116780]UIR56862.1 LysR family transcriptional regulator [Sphingobacterium sp. SRCM116780]